MPTPVFLNTGGGIFGAIRSYIAGDPNLVAAFGTRIHPGRQQRATDFPYVVMTHVNATLDDLFTDVAHGTQPGDRYDVWKETIQVSVYTDNYEATRQLGRLLHIRLSRQTLLADCQAVTLYPDSRILVLEAAQGKTAADVWHYDYRYHFWSADKLLQDQGPNY